MRCVSRFLAIELLTRVTPGQPRGPGVRQGSLALQRRATMAPCTTNSAAYGCFPQPRSHHGSEFDAWSEFVWCYVEMGASRVAPRVISQASFSFDAYHVAQLDNLLSRSILVNTRIATKFAHNGSIFLPATSHHADVRPENFRFMFACSVQCSNNNNNNFPILVDVSHNILVPLAFADRTEGSWFGDLWRPNKVRSNIPP